MSDWATVGAEVATFSGYGRFEGFTKIAKVHKNGNVVLDGSSQQYRVWKDEGLETGSGWHKGKIKPATAAVKAEIAEAIEQQKIFEAWRAITLPYRPPPHMKMADVQRIAAILAEVPAGETP